MRKGAVVFFFSLLLSSLLCSEAKNSREKSIPPVVLIPGDGGSQIEAKLDKPEVIHYICSKKTEGWFDLWLNMELLVPYVIDCWVDNMKLVYDNETRTTTNAPGVTTRIPGFGNSTTVEWLDPSHRSPTGYFKDIVNALVSLGYERGVSVRGAPFDFRRAPNEHGEYFRDLRRLIEETYQSSGRKVILILHSMGAPMMHYFLNLQEQHWKDKHIETVVSLAGAWGGSIKAVKVYTAGDNLGIYVISSLKVRAEQRSAPSLAFLLPSSDLWGPDDVLVETPTKNYSTSNFQDLFDTLNLPDAYEMYLDTKDLLKNPPAPGVEVHCLHGEGVDTVRKISLCCWAISYHIVQTMGSKYPTVEPAYHFLKKLHATAKSMENRWVGKQKQKVYHKPYQGIDHMQILRDPNVISYVVELVQNITKKNMRLSRKKAKNLFQLEKNRKDKAEQRILKTEANDIIMPRKWFDAIYVNKEEYMEQRSNSRVNKQHPNSIQALLNEDYAVTES
ncbi:phospholipase A2 group XV-like [Penaeus chinensis]|uniref:phospholipase A2 group XV-like n=1 Tax=Penaeus chinensis TaxID=139456 RepID=UPI001FB5A276|nr:phospholipase A2 group XV-like [Penaeus chinensis]